LHTHIRASIQEEPGYGADVLRLWVSSVDYTSDVMIGPQILRQMSETYRKLRGTLRYLLSNLHDWKVSANITVVTRNLYQVFNNFLLKFRAIAIRGIRRKFSWFFGTNAQSSVSFCL